MKRPSLNSRKPRICVEFHPDKFLDDVRGQFDCIILGTEWIVLMPIEGGHMV